MAKRKSRKIEKTANDEVLSEKEKQKKRLEEEKK
jgi:hypothetical protein